MDEVRKYRKVQRRVAIEEGWDGPLVSANGIKSDLVFRQRKGNPLNAQSDGTEWKAYVNAVDVPAVRVHDPRHTVATTLLLLMGVDRIIVMEMVGWSSAIMLMRYRHVLDVMKTDTAQKIGWALWAPPVTLQPPTQDNIIDFSARRKLREG